MVSLAGQEKKADPVVDELKADARRASLRLSLLSLAELLVSCRLAALAFTACGCRWLQVRSQRPMLEGQAGRAR